MKNRLLFVIFGILCIFSCQRNENRKLLSELKTLGITYPDSALMLLEETFTPKHMNEREIADWCLQQAILRDSLKEKMEMDTALFGRTVRYYERKGSMSERAKAFYYYGRVLVFHKQLEEAVPVYLKALEYADLMQQYNLAGYISSYTGDVYIDEFEYATAKNYFKKAAEYFQLAGNSKSEAFAYRDLTHTCLGTKMYEEAYNWLLKADSINQQVKDLVLTGSLANHHGLSYHSLGKYELADPYIKEAIKLRPHISANYLLLIDNYIRQDKVDEARNYLDSLHSQINDIKVDRILYHYHYLLEKWVGNPADALNYYEKSIVLRDSIAVENQYEELMKVDKKYNRQRLINENNQIKIEQQNYFLVLIACMLIVVLLIAIILIQRTIRKNRQLKLEHELEIHKKELLAKEQETKAQQLLIESKESEFLLMRHFLLEKSLLYSKLRLITDLPVSGNKEREFEKGIKKLFLVPFLSKTDWETMRELMERIYPTFIENLQKADIIKDSEINFCCLLRFGLPSDKVILLLNITKDSLKSKRYRIIKKLDIANKDIKLEDYLETL